MHVSLAMRMIAIVLACLIFQGHVRRVQQRRGAKPLRDIATVFLAPDGPSTAWQVAGPPAWLPPRHTHISMQADKVSQSATLGPHLASRHLAIEDVVTILEADSSKILHTAPNWGVFAGDFNVVAAVEEPRSKVEGLGANKLLFKLIRRICTQLGIKDELQVAINSEADGSLVASWKGQLHGEKKLPGEEFPMPFVRFIDAEVKFLLNDENQVAHAVIEKLLVNGQPFQWPDLPQSDHLDLTLKKLKEWVAWANDLQDVSPCPVLYDEEDLPDAGLVEYEDGERDSGPVVICDGFECYIQEEADAFKVDEHMLNTGHKIWDAGRLLSQILLSEYHDKLKDMRVLELGSGTGVAGLAAASAGAQVLLTDGSEGVLPLLQANVKANNFESQAKVCQLLWGSEHQDTVRDSGPYDLIIGSDLLYTPEIFPQLLDSLEELCVPFHTEVLLTFPPRFTEDIFFEEAKERNFKFVRPITDIDDCGMYAASLELQAFKN
mmetsp:Transcript_94734/g.173625  ORF Transcript_94734/g.173625 Transcript_94734/m.173625 type:complete len:492 (+) Transcript_94734:68-1543(+)